MRNSDARQKIFVLLLEDVFAHETGERARLADVILRNYGEHGIWTLTRESYQDLLKQRYGALGDALRALAFRDPAEALSFYSSLQSALFAA